jgi:hypothetical protein
MFTVLVGVGMLFVGWSFPQPVWVKDGVATVRGWFTSYFGGLK